MKSLALVLVSLSFLLQAEDDLSTLLLVWQRDPSTTMTLQWIHTDGEARPRNLHVWADGSDEPTTLNVPPIPLNAWRGHHLHRIEVTNLHPDTLYRFRVHDHDRVFSFRTLPDTLKRPIRIAIGGDMLHRREWMDAVNRQVARHDIDFLIIGGDFAYADAREERLDRWDDWFASLHETLLLPGDRILPIVAAIGNHEVQRGYFHHHDDFEDSDAWRLRVAPYFYQLFAFPSHPGYDVLDVGDYLSLILLDSDHTQPVAGAQTEWLAETLTARAAGRRHLVPVYHIPAWPSHRPFGLGTSAAIREHWVPLFEQHGVQVAFEHHDHTYKRTHPLRANAIHPERGITYVGDGAWGVGTRPVHDPEETWYLKRAESVHHFILMTLTPEGPLTFQAIRETGEVVDRWQID